MYKIILGLMLLMISASAQADTMMRCMLNYNLQGWSFIYRDYSGYGTVVCSNGERALVRLRVQGGGATIGKSEIDDGSGVISDVKNIAEVFGSYAFLQGHAGATKSVEGVVLTKGTVSLALSGMGRGIDIGVSIGKFSIFPMQQR